LLRRLRLLSIFISMTPRVDTRIGSVSFTSSYSFVLAVSDALPAGYFYAGDICMTYQLAKGHKVVSWSAVAALPSGRGCVSA